MGRWQETPGESVSRWQTEIHQGAKRKNVSDEVYRKYLSLKGASFMPEEVWMSYSERNNDKTSSYKLHKSVTHARASLRGGAGSNKTGNVYRRSCCKWELYEVWVDGVELHREDYEDV